jgi:hypothetical protein
MKVLIACEESQAVCIEFRKLGIEAFSCDIQPCSGGHPEWHIIGDAIKEAYSGKYDMMIAHPPCTYLSKAGARWTYKGGILNEDRYQKGLKAKDFFMVMLNAPIKYIAIENPVPMKVFKMPVFSQSIQPYMFGDPYSKKTLLWIKNLPKLYHNSSANLFDTLITHTESFVPYLPSNTGGKKKGQKYSIGISKNAKQSSKTFPGIAKAMATQWSKIIEQL